MDIVLTDWRGVFTSEHPTLQSIPHSDNSHYGSLALMALHYAPHRELRNLPAVAKSWREVDTLESGTHLQYRATLIEHPTQARNILMVTGDARAVLRHCSYGISKMGEKVNISSSTRYMLEQEISYEESRGIFPIGIAIKHMHHSIISRDDISELTFLGIARTSFEYVDGAHHVMHNLRTKNIDIKILSSMPKKLSRVIARHVGLFSSEDTVIDGELIGSISDQALRELVSHVNIFAELELSDEMRIMRLLEESGHRLVHHKI